jgi:TRAP transporter TAXI family solute receptor
MLGFIRWHLFIGFAAILCIAGIVSLALIYFIPAPPSKITIATSFKGGHYGDLGLKYQKILARSHVEVELRATDGAVDNLKLLNDPKSGIQIALMQGGISNGDRAPDLLSLGRIDYQAFWLFHRASDAVDDLTRLKGKRIALGPAGSGTRAVSEKILGIGGINYDNTTLLTLAADNAVNALGDGTIDALFLVFAPDSLILQKLLTNPKFTAMSFTKADALTRIYPFLVRLVLPSAVIDYERNIPATDIITVATTNVVLVRKDTNPALVDLMAQTIMEAHNAPGLFQRVGEFPTLTDPEFPFAQSARDYYKNGPSFLNRYLPFWMVNHVQRLLAVLLAAGVIVYPLFNLAPKLYRWLLQDRMRRLYRRLRIVEKAMKGNPTASQLATLQSDLENIDRVSAILPMRHSETYFGLKRDIDATRTHLASRLVRSHTANAA